MQIGPTTSVSHYCSANSHKKITAARHEVGIAWQPAVCCVYVFACIPNHVQMYFKNLITIIIKCIFNSFTAEFRKRIIRPLPCRATDTQMKSVRLKWFLSSGLYPHRYLNANNWAPFNLSAIIFISLIRRSFQMSSWSIVFFTCLAADLFH